MAALSHHEITMFLLAIAVLLGVARILGEIARVLHQPAVLGEILAGVLLGPTLFGRLYPELQASLFPLDGPQAVAMQGLFLVAVTLFLLVAGMEVDLSVAFRQGKAAISVAFFGMIVPFALGFGFSWFFPWLLMAVEPGKELVFALFFATALSISALPVIAKILKDLNLIKTDMGVIIIASATVNDLLGWIIFAVVLGMMGTGQNSLSLGMVIGLTLLFTCGMLTVGRIMVHRLLPWLQAHTSWPAGVLGFALTGSLVCAAFTEWIGIHAIFGAFIFGVALGDSRHLRERTRATLDQFISFIFAPLFFASIGLMVDFVSNFNLIAVVVVFVLATIGKLSGCYWGGRLAGLDKRECWAIGYAQNARGAMEIILGLLALQFGVIDEPMFVALVIMALVTSMLAGTLMQKVLKRAKTNHFSDFLSSKAFVPDLNASTRDAGIRRLAEAVCAGTTLDVEKITNAVLERESLMPTGLPNRIAIPHARVANLTRPIIAAGLSHEGIDFDAPDGHPASLIFLILTPDNDPSAQLQILSGIAGVAKSPALVDELLHAQNFTELLALLKARDEILGGQPAAAH